MPTISSEDLTKLCQAIFIAVGTPPETAHTVVTSLVKSNLRGHDSHGVQLIPGYVERIQANMLNPTAKPALERQTGAVAIVNGRWSFGQIVARFGVDLAISMAREFSIACVSLSRTNHIARLGEYVQMLAEAGLASLIMTGISRHHGMVTAFGSQARLFGTNPIAWAVPVPNTQTPLVVDLATSVVAFGKVALAKSKNISLPPGMIMDKDGQPSVNPADAYDGGVLLPFGGYKGSALALMVETMTNGLAGFAERDKPPDQVGNPTLIIAYNIAAFLPPEDFQLYIASLLQRIKTSKPAPGFDEVLLPGEPESRTLIERAKNGIPIPEATWQRLNHLAQELGAV